MPYIRRGHPGDYAQFQVAAAEAVEDLAAANEHREAADEADDEFCNFVYEATVAELREFVAANPEDVAAVVACEKDGKKRATVLALAG